ncbi:hypothetical protein [Streptosporangium sp. NPDC051022]
MRDLPRRLTGRRLSPDEYFEDFYPRFWSIKEHDFWKKEATRA